MNCDYEDIRSRIPIDPLWWDEHGAPRYCEFTPDQVANIYARECVLIVVECQNCGRSFRVALSQSEGDRLLRARGYVPLSAALEAQPWLEPSTIEYGDPPNVGCCPAGPTMNSVPIKVLEFWSNRRDHMHWERLHDYELEDIRPDWASDPI